ncbi:MAG: HYExAFE family protein [Planctomycetes bacterium]|nr:HYExAFE family protein [Planctomycetota bacterium]
MANRDNHYEAAFEALLREQRIPYVAVDEARRAKLGDASMKSLDFIVSTVQGWSWLVDVKGRRFPSGRQKQYWRNWSTQDDLASLTRWEHVFGQQSRGLFVFAYLVVGDRAPLPLEQLYCFREQWYGFVAIPLAHYAAHARQLSPRWGTVSMPVREFRQLAAPWQELCGA